MIREVRLADASRVSETWCDPRTGFADRSADPIRGSCLQPSVSDPRATGIREMRLADQGRGSFTEVSETDTRSVDPRTSFADQLADPSQRFQNLIRGAWIRELASRICSRILLEAKFCETNFLKI